MADALVSPPVAAVMGAISVAALIVAVRKVKQNSSNTQIAPLMGVMGAFIFAAQMLNFTIPGTGSSGHIVGGVLLASVLGPWAALITLSSVLVIQAFFFADGGLLALGCNVFNMGVTSCLIAFPLIYKPIVRHRLNYKRILLASVLCSVVGLELGAFAVTLETELSGITVLPMSKFLLFMLPIHFIIGIIEGIATALVIYFIYKNRPELLFNYNLKGVQPMPKKRILQPVLLFAGAAIVCAGLFSWYASTHPDGLEWSLFKVTGSEELAQGKSEAAHKKAEQLQEKTAIMPDYSLKQSDQVDAEKEIATDSDTWGKARGSTSVAGLTGSFIVLVVAFAIGYFIHQHKKTHSKNTISSGGKGTP